MADMQPIDGQRTRRAFLRLSGGAVLGAVLVACGDDGTPAIDDGAGSTATTATTVAGAAGSSSTAAGSAVAEATSLTAADFAGLGVCTVAPEQTEGPFYLDDDLVRRDITEGLSGHALRVGLQVVDESCAPIPGAAVDLWHADIDGDYSGYRDGNGNTRGDGDGGSGTVFLRGTQIANDEGIVEFVTVYPGWYPGRTVHMHLKVHIDDSTVLTSQLFFDDGLSDEVFTEALYADGRGERDIRNDDDGIFGGNGDVMTTRADGAGTLALAVIGVSP